VVDFDLDATGAGDTLAALGDAGLAVGGDVTSEASVAAAYAAAVERFGGVEEGGGPGIRVNTVNRTRSSRSGKSTGNVLNVDGGVAAAYSP
jgi:hypothetical protein